MVRRTLLAMPSIQEAEEYMMHHQIAALVAFAVTIGAAVSLAQDVLDPCAQPSPPNAVRTPPSHPGSDTSFGIGAGSTMWKC